MSRGVFVTGTDTGIGKTAASRLLVQGLVGRGESVAVMKPVSSGCERSEQGLRNADALALMSASNVAASYELVNPYAFAPPVSPHLAAADTGIEIRLDRIKTCYDTLAGRAGLVIVEGVGGWQVPLSATTTVADLALALELPVILVVGMRLGCLSHALLTDQAIRSSGARPMGWVANCLEADDFALEGCIETLKTRIGSPLLASIPRIPGFEDGRPLPPGAATAALELATAFRNALPA